MSSLQSSNHFRKMEPSPRYVDRLMCNAIDKKYKILIKYFEEGRPLPDWTIINGECEFYRQYLNKNDSKTFDYIENNCPNFVCYLSERKFSRTLTEWHSFWKRVYFYEVGFGSISDVPDVELGTIIDCFNSR